jgi:biopolymer transport protein ExbD
MAEKRRFFDVWIVETNTVYREVPFTAVCDWVQQGRLLADDMLRPSGTAQWFRLGDNATFAAYLPRAEPHRADDQAEALEPVQVEFAWKHKGDDEDEDVDMIPLIDVSLVLLIFFIMTTTSVALAARIPTPEAYTGLVSANADRIWIGIDVDGNGEPIYSIGQGDEAPASNEDQGLMTQQQVLQRLDAKLKERGGAPAEVLIRPHKELPSGIRRRLQIELEKRGQVVQKYRAVSEKANP